ncbi:MAG TPA: NAD(P)/FAD-dependent oxidoreductase [Steroidobacteraceae bacterium]|nr:NAD(P)/FAD-dependent oxidoreductase [Steroidobacteraceae bacterium]
MSSFDNTPRPVAVIAGAGPAGLTAALELTRRSNIKPLVFEADRQVGGISKTVVHNGNRMDLGGHRFFSKSDWVMRWWQQILPIEDEAKTPAYISYQGQSRLLRAEPFSPSEPDRVMLVRERLSRIFYKQRYFDYPLQLNARTLGNLGGTEIARIVLSYARAHFQPISPETSLEDFLVNRFGARLYHTFFKTYTEKVWGVPCRDISADWGAQRIKGLSISRAVANALARPFRRPTDTAQKSVETSLIERFLYPKLGPGQMWEEVARKVQAAGGEVHLAQRIVGIERTGANIKAVFIRDEVSGAVQRVGCDYLISTLAVRDLVAMLQPGDTQVEAIARALPYRDFLTVGLLITRMRPSAGSKQHTANGMPPDNWIYIQEPDVKIGRLQIFNNWSPYLVADPSTIWLGLEYFCREGDELWSTPDDRLIEFAAGELERMQMIDRCHLLDGTVVRVPKAYPAYFGEYKRFNVVRRYLDGFPSLYSVGRNGMHRYNNQDHSMLSANNAVTAILDGNASRESIWDVNAEAEYHEQSRSSG